MMTRGCSSSAEDVDDGILLVCGCCMVRPWLVARLTLSRSQLTLSSRQSVIDSSQHRRPVKGLAEEAADAIYECPLLVADHIASGDQEYRQIRPYLLHESMKLKAVHSGHADVGDEAADIGQSGVDQRFGGGK